MLLKILIGNKCDNENERKVSFEQGKNFAMQNGMKFFEISAKKSINVCEAFNTMNIGNIKIQEQIQEQIFDRQFLFDNHLKKYINY